MNKLNMFIIFIIITCCPITVAFYCLFKADSIQFENVFYVFAEIVVGFSLTVYLSARLESLFYIKHYKLKQYKKGLGIFEIVMFVLLRIFITAFVLTGAQTYTLYGVLSMYSFVFFTINLNNVYFNEGYIYLSMHHKLIKVSDITEFDYSRDEKISSLNVKMAVLEDKYNFYVDMKVEDDFVDAFENLKNNTLV